MKMQPIVIKDGWHGLWHRIGAKGNNPWELYLNLVTRYTERHRYYHAFSHLTQVLKEFDQIRHLCANSDAVEMALWYHDAVYFPGESDNEKESAELAQRILHQARLPDVFIGEVVRLILLTKEHNVTQEDGRDGAILSDIDLSIFGQPLLVFDKYEQDIWKEYVRVGKMSDRTFKQGRQKFVEKFLERTYIYRTPYFRAKYEKAARANLKRSVVQLQSD